MKKIILLLCISAFLSITMGAQATAATTLPCDANSDDKLTNGEINSAVLSYMKGDNNVKLDDARDAAHVLTYWEGKPFTFKDGKNNSVTIYRPAKRVVDVEGSYGPQTIIALGAGDKLVGITDYAKKPADLAPFVEELPIVGSGSEVDVEKILTLNPDFVHGYASSYDISAQAKALNSAGIPVALIDCYQPQTYTNDMTIMGKIVGEEENASKLIAFQDYYENLVAQRVKNLTDSQKPRVYVEKLTNFVTGDSNAAYIPVCGGTNIFPEYPMSTTVSSEEIIKRNPQVIIKIIYKGDDSLQDKYGAVNQSGFGVTSDAGMKAFYQKLISRPGWDHIDAVTNKRVYLLTSEASPTHPCAHTVFVAKMIHPELFTDISGDDVLRQWYKEFMNVEYTGIYSYPTQA